MILNIHSATAAGHRPRIRLCVSPALARRVRYAALVLVLAALILARTAPASAQLFGGIVYDPTNYAQNVLQAARALQQITNQITSLQNEA